METDNTENFVIEGNLSVIANPNVSLGLGDIELSHNLYTDTILSNTIGAPVDLEQIQFLNGNFTLPEIVNPSVPASLTTSFFLNQNGFLNSINNSGSITTYQPEITKGDLTVYDGVANTQVRFPVGVDGSFLVANSQTSTGLQWLSDISVPLPTISLSSTNYNVIIDEPFGSFFACVFPRVSNGSSGNMICSKGLASNYGAYTSFSSTSTPTSGSLQGNWNPYQGFEISKTDISPLYDGTYIYNPSDILNPTYNVTLTDTTPVNFGTNTTGVLFICVSCPTQGPSANFILVKNDVTSSSSIFNRLSNSNGVNGCNLMVNWNAGNTPALYKSTYGDYSGITFEIVDNFQYVKYTSNITLSGTTPVSLMSLVPFYEKKGFFMKITSTISGAPIGFFSLSKNLASSSTNAQYSLQTPGLTTGEKLNVSWNSDSYITINKTGSGYDGTYVVTITRIA